MCATGACSLVTAKKCVCKRQVVVGCVCALHSCGDDLISFWSVLGVETNRMCVCVCVCGRVQSELCVSDSDY